VDTKEGHGPTAKAGKKVSFYLDNFMFVVYMHVLSLTVI